jgi:hypothetical protein
MMREEQEEKKRKQTFFILDIVKNFEKETNSKEFNAKPKRSTSVRFFRASRLLIDIE